MKKIKSSKIIASLLLIIGLIIFFQFNKDIAFSQTCGNGIVEQGEQCDWGAGANSQLLGQQCNLVQCHHKCCACPDGNGNYPIINCGTNVCCLNFNQICNSSNQCETCPPGQIICSGVCGVNCPNTNPQICCQNGYTCCGNGCCSSDQTCTTFNGSPYCCPSASVCSTTCCSSNETCTTVNGVRTCCPNTNVCGTGCCPSGQTCTTYNGSPWCCPNANVCGTGCCPLGQTCTTYNGNPWCCPNANVCGTNCCPIGQPCINGTCQSPTPTPTYQCPSGTNFCPPGQPTTPNFRCCAPNTGGSASGCCPSNPTICALDSRCATPTPTSPPPTPCAGDSTTGYCNFPGNPCTKLTGGTGTCTSRFIGSGFYECECK